MVPDDRITKKIVVDFSDDDQVFIRLPLDLAVGLRALGHLREVQISLVVLPALMETLAFIERVEADEQSDDLSDKAWLRPIKELSAPFEGESSHLETAQKILGSPLAVSLTQQLVLEEDEDD